MATSICVAGVVCGLTWFSAIADSYGLSSTSMSFVSAMTPPNPAAVILSITVIDVNASWLDKVVVSSE